MQDCKDIISRIQKKIDKGEKVFYNDARDSLNELIAIHDYCDRDIDGAGFVVVYVDCSKDIRAAVPSLHFIRTELYGCSV